MKEIKHKAGLELPLSVTSFFRCSYEHSLLIISTSIKPTNETPQVYGALTLFFIEPTGDIPFSDSSLPESVLYIQKKKKKKKQVSFAKHSFLAKCTVVPGEKGHTPLFPGADKSRRNTECLFYGCWVHSVQFQSLPGACFWPNPFFVFIAFLFFDSACVNLATEISDAPN